ncbi:MULTISPECIES: flagellar brake protein [unclassified Cupriavidus]|uniref:flagellar brake protein n=1 Tax=unclassified Cupriavidus TaxID=2640874 RepID=UPI000891BE41|nr:flagellar brake protein [Cupriavidus sp. YR651]SDD34469.1 c-di-GMP-binding flagellar brake protein YcgR, contains PilZNR and PilZ domains [Cupriavidus sp. YR651]
MSLHDSRGPQQAQTQPQVEGEQDEQEGTRSDERYRLTHSSQIGTVLRDMAWQKCLLNVRSKGGSEIVTSILHVDPANKTFIFDWCRVDGERQALMASEQNAFSGLLRGVPVNFMVGAPGATRFEGGPAFIADFPDKLYHFQRRRHFRARTLLTKGYRCEIRMPDSADKSVLQLDIADLSLSGVGLRSRAVGADRLPVGTVARKCLLDFGELGRLELDMQVVGHWMVGFDDNTVHHYGCAFLNPDGRMENFLQRLVFQLELAHRG